MADERRSNQTYDERARATAERFRPQTFPRRFEIFSELDEHFTNIWLNYTGKLLSRPQLDVRTRLLVLVSQYTLLGNGMALADTLRAGVDHRLDPREMLEMILQCYIYGGESPVAAATEVYVAVMEEAGLLESVKEGSLPVDATTRDRSLDDERERWSDDDRDDPRLAGLLERHGWKGISTGLRLRPGHHINLAYTLDAVDPEFLDLWLATPYEGLYARGVLDDRTRLLCVVGGCLAVGETHQSRRHMRAALRAGAQPRELMELVFQTCAIAGHPYLMPMAVDDIILICDDLGRIDEVVDPDRTTEVRRIVKARVAKRDGIAEMGTKAD